MLLEFFLIVLHFIIDNLQIILKSFEEGAPITVANLLPTLVKPKVIYELLQIIGLIVIRLDFLHVSFNLCNDRSLWSTIAIAA